MQHPNEFEDIMEKARPELTAEESAALWTRIADGTSLSAEPIPSPYWFSVLSQTPMTPFIIALMLLVGAGGTVAASEAARPGDLLFPIERATERARLAIASDDRKESLRATYADKRLEELRSIIGDVNENDDTDDTKVAVSAEGEVRISNAINALVDVLEEIETDAERERIFAALMEKVATIEVKNRGTIQVQSDEDNNARLKIKDDRIELRDGAYRLRLNGNGEVIIRDNDDDDRDDDSNSDDRDDDRRDDDDSRDDDDDTRTGIDEIEVEVEGGVAKIELDYNNDDDETYTIPFTTEAAVVTNIATRTGLTEAAVAAIMEFEMDDRDDNTDSSDDNDDRDRDDDDNNHNDDDSRDNDDNSDDRDTSNTTDLKEIDVEIENGMAEVKVTYQNDRDEEFTVPFVSETALITTIGLRTGLSQTVINGALDIAYDN